MTNANPEVTPYSFLEPVFRENKDKRNQTYSDLFTASRKGASGQTKLVEELKQNGYAILPNFFDKARLLEFRRYFDACLATGKNISAPRNLKGVDEEVYGQNIPRFSIEELSKGVESYRDQTDNVQLKDPLIHCPDMLDLALSDFFIDLASAYLDGFPALTYFKCVRNFANDVKEFDTQFFHIDENAAKLLKFFVYLNDVDENGGPFCYVKGSLRRKTDFWGKKARWMKPEIEEHFGKENVILCTAKMGDLVIADTTGFHRGFKPIKTDRNILIVNYGVHQDYTFGGKLDITSNVTRQGLASLTPKQRAVGDLLTVVD